MRASPFSTGTVKISPRASKSARVPVGPSEALAIEPLTSSQAAAAQGKSPRTVTSRPRRLAAGRGVEQPEVAVLLEGERPVAPVERLHVGVAEVRELARAPAVRVSYAQTLVAQSRSERK